jgi:hypothetical protein
MKKIILLTALLSTNYSFASLSNFLVSSDAANVTYSYSYTGNPVLLQVFLDTDKSASSGYSVNGIGANFLIENNNLYSYSGSKGSWAWQLVKKISYTKAISSVKFVVSRADLKSPSGINALAQYTSPLSASSVISHSLSGVSAPAPTPVPQPAPAPAPSNPSIPDPSVMPVSFVLPKLVNPVSPKQFGAKCDGVTDDSVAFQAAVNAGDVLVPAGKCVINKTVMISTSNKHIECAPGAILYHTNPYAGNMFNIKAFTATGISGVSIVKCRFLGTNTEAAQYYDRDERHWDIPVQANNKVDNLLIAGNTFEKFFGQAMFQTYAPDAASAGSGQRIMYNTFKSCGYYGPVFAGTKNGYIGYNMMIDCSAGVENDNPSQATGGNIIEYNTLVSAYGYGAPDMSAGVMLTGGGAGGADYSKNIVRNNTVSGKSSSAGFNKRVNPSIIFQINPAGQAQYLNNTCINGCSTIR